MVIRVIIVVIVKKKHPFGKFGCSFTIMFFRGTKDARFLYLLHLFNMHPIFVGAKGSIDDYFKEVN